MATDGTTASDRSVAGRDRDRFEDVDWDRVRGDGPRLGRRTRAYLAVLAGFGVVWLYDFLLRPPREPTVPGLGWEVTQLDWIWWLTLVTLLFYGVVPLAGNPRRTRQYWREFRRNRAAVVSALYLLTILVVGTVVPTFVAPPTIAPTEQFQPPVYTSVTNDLPLRCLGRVVEGACHGTWEHPLGTLRSGKDLLVVVVFGMRTSMQVGLISSLVIIGVATAVGTSAAYFGGYVDEALMRYVDVQLSLPEFPLYLFLVYIFGGSLVLIIAIFGLFSWGGVARLVRSEALQRREEEFVTAARSMGADDRYVIRRHIVPNVSNTVVTATTLALPGLILAEAGLAFLGLGDPRVPSWGQVISAGRSSLSDAWWISTIPGVFLFLTVMAFNFLGDALRDALDPRHDTGE